MFRKSFALYAPEGDADGGAGGGGSPNGGSGGDDDVVPKKQFIAAVNSASRKAEALEAKVNELTAKLEAATAKPADAPKRYTRAELKAAVEAGQISQDQADSQWDLQTRQEADARAEQVARATVTAAERSKEVNATIERYKAVAPEILDESHETRQSIRTEFNALVALGDDPRDVATQLKAIRMVLGPVEKLEKSRGGTDVHDTHRETGGGGEGGGNGGKKTGKLHEQLNAQARKHYEKGIEQGRYKDWAEVDAELKYASPQRRQSLGIAA